MCNAGGGFGVFSLLTRPVGVNCRRRSKVTEAEDKSPQGHSVRRDRCPSSVLPSAGRICGFHKMEMEIEEE